MAPIGVFDSGIGGLSVLRALRRELPHEQFVYLADSAQAPYGERPAGFVSGRSLTLAHHLVSTHPIKALVVACNTATAAAVDLLRQHFVHLPIVGVEPALKPAVAHTRTHRVGVMATRGTLGSARFAQLLGTMPTSIDWVLQPCDGLAQAIEDRAAPRAENAASRVDTLCGQHTRAMGRFGSAPGQIDTLVLGCTHYVFAADSLRALLGPDVALIDTGEPVARQTRRLLEAAGALATAHAHTTRVDGVRLFTTGALPPLQAAAAHWLQLAPQTCKTLLLPD